MWHPVQLFCSETPLPVSHGDHPRRREYGLTFNDSKCGRVVCNSCSPHRITIPYQYIVRPPHAPRPVPHGPPLSLLDSQGWYPEFGGGEKVRLCNPCVPDPNVAPPHDQGRQPRPRTELNSPGQAEISPSDRLGFYLGVGSSSDAHTRTRSVTLVRRVAACCCLGSRFPGIP